SQFGAGGASGIVLQGDGPSTELESVSLGSIAFAPARCLFLKLDCEGAEGEIIERLCANLSRLPAKVNVACEYHHWCPLSLDDLLHLLRAHGFEAESRILYDESSLFAARGQPA
nr:FkbM family methyltransferase [Blastocatellia bacterium]